MFVYNYITQAIIIEVVGLIAGILLAVSLSPQIIRAWKTKSAKDISAGWTLVYLFSLILWLIYGFETQTYPLVIMAILEIPLFFSIFILKRIYKK